MLGRRFTLVVGMLSFAICVCFLGCDLQSNTVPRKENKADRNAEQARVVVAKEDKADGHGDQAHAVVKRALQAHGGKARIERLRFAQVIYRIQGNFPLMPAFKDIDIALIETYQLPNRIKKEIRGHADGKEINLAWCADNEQYWYWEQGNQTQILNKHTDVESQYRPYRILEDLANLDTNAWEVIDNPVDAPSGSITVRCKAEGEANGGIYYFNRETGLLAGSKVRKFIPILGRECWMAGLLGDYKEVDGLQLFHSMVGYQDGVKTSSNTIKEVRLLDAVDERVFAAP